MKAEQQHVRDGFDQKASDEREEAAAGGGRGRAATKNMCPTSW